MLARPRDLRVRTEIDFEYLSVAMAALSNPTRLRLLVYLTEPHYLEEVASHLKLSRQAARKHVEKMLELGLLEKRSGKRDTGRVVEYQLDPRALFLIYDEFGKLGTLRSRSGEGSDRTLADAGHGLGPGALPAGSPAFRVVHGFRAGRVVPLEHNEARRWVLGRGPRSDVVVDSDPYVSTRHAEVHVQGRGFALVDCASMNGTFLNWERLPRGGQHPLAHGDVVGIGRNLLLFATPAAVARG